MRADGPQTTLHSRTDTAPFEGSHCLNCGADLTGKYCPDCGQKRQGRLGRRDLTDLAWQNLRRFEFSLFRSMAQIALAPGKVARHYVLGARGRYLHPFKLLLTCIVFLLIVVAQTNYLTASTKELSKAVELLQSWSKWSFSLGVFAVWIASMAVFWRWHPFNAVEHLVLAAYAHSVVLMANMVNIAPLMLTDDPATVIAHRTAAKGYMTWVEAAIVVWAYVQFFQINLRRQWWWAALGAVAFVIAKKALIAVYARAIVHIVMRQLA